MSLAFAHDEHANAGVATMPGGSPVAVGNDAPLIRGIRLPDGSVFLPKPAQFRLGIRSMIVASGRQDATLTLQGVIVPDPNHSAVVTSIEKGLLDVGPQGFPITGTRVSQGQTLAIVRPTLELADRVKRNAALALANQDLNVNTQNMRLLGVQLVGQNRMTTTTAFQQNLITEKLAIDGRIKAANRILNGHTTLTAPIAGEISVANAQIGSLVVPGQTVFEIIDPSRLWVEVQSYGVLPSEIIGKAVARTQDGAVLDLAFEGQGLTTTGQALPLDFRITHTPGQVYVGQPVTVTLTARSATTGTVLPKACVGRAADGDSQVWLQSTAEHFIAHDVETGEQSGDKIVIESGVRAGDRVVCQGGWLLDQIH